MHRILSSIHLAVLAALLLWSISCLWEGYLIIEGTSGTVRGSEFGMLITLANLMGRALVWMCLFGATWATKNLTAMHAPAVVAPAAVPAANS